MSTILLCAVLMVLSCAKKQITRSHQTGKTRERRTKVEYGFLAGKPTVENPFIMFKLIRTESYKTENEIKYNKIEQTSPGGLIQVGLIPLWLSLGIVSLGEFNLYNELKHEEVIEYEKKWETDSEKREKKVNEELKGVPIVIQYEYAGEKRIKKYVTDSQGEVRMDLRKIAKSVALDPDAQDYVVFTIESKKHDCLNKIRIVEEFFLEIYKKYSEEGFCFEC